MGSSPTYDQWSCSPVIKFLYSTIEPKRQHLCHVVKDNMESLLSAMILFYHNKKKLSSWVIEYYKSIYLAKPLSMAKLMVQIEIFINRDWLFFLCLSGWRTFVQKPVSGFASLKPVIISLYIACYRFTYAEKMC